jgi:predicted transcriptional regulator
MKVAVSIPDPVFTKAEALAGRLRTSRSELYARALAAYVDRHAAEDVTAALNAVVDEVGGRPDEFVQRAALNILRRTDW